ncbi:MAG: GNAT family N-acetyltransferase [Candidatus Latescibacterota bacterium]
MKLDTQRLILREVEATDVDAMFAWQVDLRYLEHYPVERTSRQDTLDLVGRFIGWKLERPRWRWQLAITLPISGELIGSCGVRRAEPDSPSADIGYELNPDHWGHDYATEAVGRNVAFVFDEVGLDELTARTVVTNSRSIRVLERLGFSHSLSIPPGTGKDGRDWPQRSEYRLPREDWSPCYRSPPPLLCPHRVFICTASRINLAQGAERMQADSLADAESSQIEPVGRRWQQPACFWAPGFRL